MPYIAINTSKTLSDTQKDEIKALLGERITLIPGKEESRLMVDISDGRSMYFAGERRELAFVDVRCYGTTEFAHKKVFTEAAFEALNRAAGLPGDSIYLSYSEFDTWGTLGSMK
jgi:hypothetical protein